MAENDTPDQKKADLELLADAKAVWVEHTAGHENPPGANGRLLNAARRAGFDPVMLQTYYDRNGRPMFQTLRFTPGKLR